MVSREEDENNREYADNYARGRSGEGSDTINGAFIDRGSIEYKAYKAGQEDREKYGPLDRDDCGTGESAPDSCCYIVSACLDNLNLPRSSLEMKAMKKLTREFILKSFSGKRDYITYGKIGPAIVRSIQSTSDSQATWQQVYGMLQGIARKVEEGKYQESHDQFKSLVLGLEAQFKQ
ncbi:MAG: hypothetical protein WCK29_04540 [archaeon]